MIIASEKLAKRTAVHGLSGVPQFRVLGHRLFWALCVPIPGYCLGYFFTFLNSHFCR